MHWIARHNIKMAKAFIAELDQIVNMDQIPNTKLFSFWKFYEYRIPNYSFFENFTNTELFGFWKWTNTEYRIVLFGLNYSNTEYLKSNSSPPKNFICEFCDQMRWGKFDPLFSYLHEGFLLCFFYTYLAYKKF